MLNPLIFLIPLRMRLDAAEIYRRAKGAVVTLRTSMASGTGFALGDRRTVVTAYHVVKDSPETIHVDQTGASAVRLVGFDGAADVALLELSRPVGGALTLRKGDTPQPGTKVFVIGTPLGYLESTISEGIVSGVRRLGDVALLQITAPVSHGSSGGPVLDEEGRVVGIVEAVLQEGQSLNFATSAYNVERALAEIRSRSHQTTGLFDDLLDAPRIGKRKNYPVKSLTGLFDDIPDAPDKRTRRRDIVMLTGPAALYCLYRRDRAAANTTFNQRERSPYHLSQNGMMYYRDSAAVPHWVTPPASGISVPAKEAKAYRGLQGYNGSRTGETNLMRFAKRHGGA